ncbi:hypothetical protein NEHOM01_1305 [Nematocida homosporus]|uniref:uncharacterized protein n=1 Tax=Nematocida homosporus TaxID=1912981 RepID=UPI00221FAA0D|nr:uncharacterized protein NEHOM01_1305 [Nematocida homosporus]KAI5186140.1 hypothetical protein NEHOM01_1305 [Nematocida homosporus]
MFESRMIAVKPIDIWWICVFRWGFGLGVCILFGLMNGVCGSDSIDMRDLPSSAEVTKTLRSLGFNISRWGSNLQIEPYISSYSQDISGTGSSLLPPLYVVDCWEESLCFDLPNYRSIEKATAALEKLREIAFIKTPDVVVNCTLPNRKCHQINIQILTRVVNMFDCLIMRLTSNIGRIGDADIVELDSIACWTEAQHTVKHAVYRYRCQLCFSSKAYGKDRNLINRSIVLLRPISSVCLRKSQYQNTSCLTELPLKPNYDLFFTNLPPVAEIDLSILQQTRSICRAIKIIRSSDLDIMITGLENATDVHPRLVLEADWMTLRYLCENNRSHIKVHTIINPVEPPYCLQALLVPLPPQTISNPRIAATIAVVSIGKGRPCQSLEYYERLYTKEAYAMCGITVEEVQFKYEVARDDLHDTIDTLCQIKALPTKVLDDVKAKNIVCCGQQLNYSDWSLQDKVSIKLNHHYLGQRLEEYKAKHDLFFCQNIRYNTIDIQGDHYASIKYFQKCLDCLDLFHNITAKTLRIMDVRSNGQLSSRFDLAALRKEAARRPMRQLKVQTLVLDNVDERIIYRILGCYVFVESVDVHILNQRFKNLAIAEILSQPTTHNINSLVINDFFKLDEVVRYKKQHKIKSFSLFRYVEDAIKAGKSLQDLGLHKLVLSLNNVDYSLYNEVLNDLLSYGIRPSPMSFEAYMEWLAKNPNTKLVISQKELVLADITLEALKADLAISQPPDVPLLNPAQPRNLPSSSVPKRPVKKVVLLLKETPLLSESDLVTIIRWTAHCFKDVICLEVRRTKILDEERNVVAGREYMVRGLGLLTSIRIEDGNTKRPNIQYLEVRARPHSGCFLMCSTNTEPEFTAVTSATIHRLAISSEQLDNLAPSGTSLNKSLQMIIDDIKKNGSDIECPVCYRVLYVPPEEINTAEPAPAFSSMINAAAFCYFRCGHQVCSDCVDGIKNKTNDLCPLCRNKDVCVNLHRLVDIPLSSFVFVEDSAEASAANRKWLECMALGDGYVYLYIAHGDLAGLASGLADGLSYDASHKIHVI